MPTNSIASSSLDRGTPEGAGSARVRGIVMGTMRNSLARVLILLMLVGRGFCTAASGDGGCFVNPICEQADPWIIQYHGQYLACFAEGNRGISIHASDRLTHLGIKHVVWTAPASGPASQEIWAPELHHLGGRWYIYFAASDGQNRNHRAWVLESDQDDPANAAYDRLDTAAEGRRTLESGHREQFKPAQVAKPMDDGEDD